MRLKTLLVSLALLACAIPSLAVTPAAVQTCEKTNGGVSMQLYTVTIGSSGGSTGCTSDFSSGDAIIVAYHQLSGSSDRTTSNISATGATITWRKAISIQSGIFSYWTGIFYACPADITSPTNSIAITVDMGASMAGLTAIYAQQAHNIQSTSCLDKTGSGSDCCNGSPFYTGLSGTLSNASEYAFATAVTDSGTNPVLVAHNGGTCAGSCFNFDPIPTNGNDNQSGSSSAIESVALSTTTTGVWVFNQSNAALAQNIVGATFIAGASAPTVTRGIRVSSGN